MTIQTEEMRQPLTKTRDLDSLKELKFWDLQLTTFGILFRLKTGKMKIIIFIALFISSISHANEIENVLDFSRELFKGGKAYKHEEIKSVSENKSLSEHHRVIFEIQMLASVDDTNRYEKAIEIASDYIQSGNIEWVRNYLLMQRGFLRNLNGEREAGNQDLETVINDRLLVEIGLVHDPVIEAMKSRHENLSSYFNDVIRQSIGHHYLDFNTDGINPEKAYYYFDGIKSNGLREKCLNQLKDRAEDVFDQIDRDKIVKKYNNELGVDRRLKRKERRIPTGISDEKAAPIGSKALFYMGGAIIAILVGLACLWALKRKIT